MDAIISFFRDTLDGTGYIIWLVILGLLVLSCIGYLAERHYALKDRKAMYEKAKNPVENTTTVEPNAQVKEVAPQPIQQQVTEPVKQQVTEPIQQPTNTTGQ